MSDNIIPQKKILELLKIPWFWVMVIVFILISIPYLTDSTSYPGYIIDFAQKIGLDKHLFELVLYLLPMIMAGFIFSWWGTIITSCITLLIMLAKIFFQTPIVVADLIGAISIFLVGTIIAVALVASRKEKVHRIQLVALNKVARAVSQSLELEQVLSSSIDSVMSVMNIDAALIFLVAEDGENLTLASYKGVSEKFAGSVSRLVIEESLNGTVVTKGEPEIVEDAVTDSRVARSAEIAYENLRSQFIVPLRSKRKVMGTLCVATHSKYQFNEGEMETAIAIGNQIGVAVENARIYEQEKRVAKQLRVSEEKYKQLFENAHDAIWSDNINGDIIAANEACVRQSGYSLAELFSLKSADLLSQESREMAREIRRSLLTGETEGLISEVKLIKKDGTEAHIQLASSVLYTDGKPTAFQHIARDITEERKMQENLRFYLEQVTKAQEEERKRISRELHDDTVQALVVLGRDIDDLENREQDMSTDKKKLLSHLRKEVNNIMAGVRNLSQNLRPPALDRLGLIPALEWLTTTVHQHSGIPVLLKIDGKERRLSDETEMLLFRITQEALSNVRLHSRATEALVTIKFNDANIAIVIQDNGIGIDLNYSTNDLTRVGKLGIAGIRERVRLLNGKITIESQPGVGMTINVEVPL